MTTFREKAIEELARLEREAAELRAYLELTGASPAVRIDAVKAFLDTPSLGVPLADVRPMAAQAPGSEVEQLRALVAGILGAPVRVAEPTIIAPDVIAQANARRGSVPLSPEEEHAVNQARLTTMLNGGPVPIAGALVTDPKTGTVTRVP